MDYKKPLPAFCYSQQDSDQVGRLSVSEVPPQFGGVRILPPRSGISHLVLRILRCSTGVPEMQKESGLFTIARLFVFLGTYRGFGPSRQAEIGDIRAEIALAMHILHERFPLIRLFI